MEMRKFIVEIHPDGRLTCCEYEDPREDNKAATHRAWLEGFHQALTHCQVQVETLEAFKNTCLSSRLMYEGAAKVRNVVASCYREYSTD